MCGIVGVIGQGAPEKAFNGLKALEYRGYDSWGIAAPQGNTFYLERHVGKIGEAKPGDMPKATISLSHNRWATHGRVTEQNAHPHLSMDRSIAIVHNGIVENFSELKKELQAKGYVFRSDTDSEVISNLIQESMKQKSDFKEAVRHALLRLNGYYAIAAMHIGEDKIICGRNGSPLVVGIGNGELFVASDATAFIDHTKNVLFIKDSEMAVLGNRKVEAFDLSTGKQVKYAVKELSWNSEAAKKGNYPHFMLKEIHEQPATIILAANQPKEKLSEIVALIKSAKKVFLAGCGSSYHACIAASYFFSNIAGRQVFPMLASEFENHAPFFGKDTLVIGVSQSGETADLLEALRVAKKSGAKIASIVNVMDSSVMRMSECTLLMNAGPEICVLSTKSYTSQLSILLLIAYALKGQYDKGTGTLLFVSKKLGESIGKIESDAKSIARELSKSKDMFVIGRQGAYPAALEGALKIKEVSYIHAEGFAGAELKHGTISLIEDGTPAIVLVTPETQHHILSNAIEMRSRGASIIGIDSANSDIYNGGYIEVPECGIANPIMLAIPMQLLAYYLALERGLDIDHPRSLAKSVTVR